MQKICILTSVHAALDNRIFYREAHSLLKAGYQVTIVAPHTTKEMIDSIQILPLPRVPRWRRPFMWQKLLAQALSTQADLYHFHDSELLLIAPYFRYITKRPTIYDIHESTADFLEIKNEYPKFLRSLLSRLIRRFEPKLAGMQSGLIFADEQIADHFSTVQIPKATLLNYPRKLFVDRAVEATKNIKTKQPNILYLGGIKQERNIILMIDAFQNVLHEYPNAHLLLVGPFFPPTLEHEIQKVLSNRGMVNAVITTGAIPFENIGEYLLEAAIGWIPFPPVAKYQKNIPTKLFEYMAYSLPIVSSDLSPVQPYLTNGKNGYLVPANDLSAHAEAILRLLRDPQQALSMGRYGQKLVSASFTWEKMEIRLLDLYDTILNS